MIGYMNGLALTILVGQLPKLFGFSVDADGLIAEIEASSRGSRDGEAVGRRGRRDRRDRPDPGAAALAAEGARRARRGRAGDRRGVASSTSPTTASSLVGVLPQGFPPLTVPHVAGPTSGRCSPARSASRWSRSPTRSPPRPRSPPGPARRSTATRRCSGSAPRTWPPACSRASRSAPAARVRRWRSAPGAQTQLTGVIGAVLIIADDRAGPRAAPEPAATGPRPRW